MSEPNNTFPFPGIEAGGTLDISAIFGSSTPGGDLNPFEMPAAKGPVEMDPLPQEYAPAAGPKLEPAAEAESAAEPETEQPSAAPAPEEEVVTGPTWKQAVPPPNLISAAFDKQEEKNTQQGLLEKPPVFAYGSAKEPIKDPGMTFEELRIDKAEDFPELAEGKKVSWTVEYGKTVKIITDPKGTTIQSIKAEIEQSKAFLDGLKKAKDKNPDCLVKPRVTAQSKGIAAYKGVFSSLEEARASDKTICIVPAGDGRIYELRKSELGEFIVPKNNVVEFPQIRAGFTPALPLIPMFLLGEVISFFRCYMNEREEFEAMAHILWDKENEEFVVHIPEQEVSKAHINADLSRDTLPESRYLHYADIHSHNSMEARFSSTDDRDEKATRLYIVLGRLDRFFPEISVRMSCGGVFQPLDPATVLESVGEVFPHQWHDNVKKQPRPPRRMVGVSPWTGIPIWRDVR